MRHGRQQTVSFRLKRKEYFLMEARVAVVVGELTMEQV
jgi:hypothetical protein